MASETIDPIDWSYPHIHGQYPLAELHTLHSVYAANNSQDLLATEARTRVHRYARPTHCLCSHSGCVTRPLLHATRLLCYRPLLSGVHTMGDDVGKGNSHDQRCLGSALALCATSYTTWVVHNLAITLGDILVSAVLVYSPLPTSRPAAVIEWACLSSCGNEKMSTVSSPHIRNNLAFGMFFQKLIKIET